MTKNSYKNSIEHLWDEHATEQSVYGEEYKSQTSKSLTNIEKYVKELENKLRKINKENKQLRGEMRWPIR